MIGVAGYFNGSTVPMRAGKSSESRNVPQLWSAVENDWYRRPVSEGSSGNPPTSDHGLPERCVTINQLVGFNTAYFRKVADRTQEEFGAALGGWSGASVSAAERSWEGKRVRKFDTDEIVKIAGELGVPVIALLLPPPDAGTAVQYRFDFGGYMPADVLNLLRRVVPEYGGDSPAMTAFRQRLLALGAASLVADPALAAEEAQRILRRAKTEADLLLAEASQQVDWMLADAEGRAEDLVKRAGGRNTTEHAEAIAVVINDARREADETLGRARREVDDILTKARRQSEHITSDARARAENLERDAQRRYNEAMGSLPEQREQLERRVSDLRDFEREYRARLLAYIDSQRAELTAGASEGEFPHVGVPDRDPPARSEDGS